MKSTKVKEPPRIVEVYKGCNILRAYDYDDKFQVGILVIDTIEKARAYVDQIEEQYGGNK